MVNIIAKVEYPSSAPPLPYSLSSFTTGVMGPKPYIHPLDFLFFSDKINNRINNIISDIYIDITQILSCIKKNNLKLNYIHVRLFIEMAIE